MVRSARPSFAGNGSGLTSINPANIAAGTAGTSASRGTLAATATTLRTWPNSALDATNADNLGNVAAADYDAAGHWQCLHRKSKRQRQRGDRRIVVHRKRYCYQTKHTLGAVQSQLPPVLGKLTCATASFAFNGVSGGDTTAVGVPNARMNGPGNFVYTAWVSAANMITIQGCNVSGTSQTAAGTGNIRVDVWKH